MTTNCHRLLSLSLAFNKFTKSKIKQTVIAFLIQNFENNLLF